MDAGVFGNLILSVPIRIDRPAREGVVAFDESFEPEGGVLRGFVIKSFVPCVADVFLSERDRKRAEDGEYKINKVLYRPFIRLLASKNIF